MKAKIRTKYEHGEAEIEHTIIDDNWAYRNENGLYYLTHRPTGKMFGSYLKVGTIKELLKEECFFNDKFSTGDENPPVSWLEVRNKYFMK